VKQQFNTATSMGRLVLNVLLSFAQFEREIIAERTRDKMAATRRKGKWSGGMPVLGYDLDPRGRRLHVNDDEAERVRAIFALYLEHRVLLPVVQELARRGWLSKCWQTRNGRQRGGRPFTKFSSLCATATCFGASYSPPSRRATAPATNLDPFSSLIILEMHESALPW
jgi:site-specific DNA recombinase